MRLVLNLDPSAIGFEEINSSGKFPYLKAVGELRTAARAGDAVGDIAGTESSSLPVTLDNRYRRVAKIIRRPIRVKAFVYDDADVLLFAGTVSAITYENTETHLDIDA